MNINHSLNVVCGRIAHASDRRNIRIADANATAGQTGFSLQPLTGNQPAEKLFLVDFTPFTVTVAMLPDSWSNDTI
jgi:hypothetical protein